MIWRKKCKVCGEYYDFETCPFCFEKMLKEKEEVKDSGRKIN